MPNLQADRLKKDCKGHEKAAIFYYVVDLKVNEHEQIKILDFGRGFQSGISGYNELFGCGKSMPEFF